MAAYRLLLQRNPGYARLWLAQAISLLGDWFNTVVLFAVVTANSPPASRGLAISGLLLARFVPPLLFGPLAGVLVDRMNRKRLLIASDALRAGVVVLFLFATTPDRLWLIYVLTVLQFALSAIFEPGRSALIPGVTRPEDLVLANTLGSVTWSVMLAAGAAIGGFVAGTMGISAALMIDALSFLLSALFIASIRVDGRPRSLAQNAQQPEATFRDGLRYLRAHPATLATVLVKMGGSVGSIDLLMTVYATSFFVVGENGIVSLGILWSAFGVGAVIGPLALNRFNDGTVRVMRRLIIVGYVWISLGWLFFGMAPSLAVAALALAVKAMGSSIYWTYSSVILQKTVSYDFLGRVFSIDLAGFQLSTVISTLVVGALVDRMAQQGPQQVRLIAYGSMIVSLIPLLLWALIVPRLERRELVTAGEIER